MDDELFMSEAIVEAKKAFQNGTLPVGAVAVQRNQIVGRGHRSHLDRYLGHAEINALKAALSAESFNPIDRLTIYSTLEPCAMCWGTLIHCPVEAVIFALEDPWGGATSMLQGSNVARHRGRLPKTSSGLLRTEALVLFQQFGVETKETFWRDRSNPLVRLMQQGPDKADRNSR